MHTTSSETPPALVTIPEAIRPFHGVTVPMVRAWIRRGELPSVKAGKAHLIDPRDLAARLRPALREASTKSKRETENERAKRQLREAGLSV
jgi:hypothetical protein